MTEGPSALLSRMTSCDADIRLFTNNLLADKSRRRLERLIEDLNLEISSMPSALRNPFRIVRDMAIEMLSE